MTEMFRARSPIDADSPENVESAVRNAIGELQEILQSHGMDASFTDIAKLGHSESWDDDGQRWVQVEWPVESGEENVPGEQDNSDASDDQDEPEG